MAKKSNKMAATYGRKSTAPKKKRPVKTVPDAEATAFSSQSNVESIAPEPQVRTVTRPPASVATANEYVMADIKRVSIIAAVLFATLIVLAFVL